MKYLRVLFPISIVVLILSLTSCGRATPTSTATPAEYPQVTVPGSQIRQMHSEQTGRDYDLYIRLPEDYGKFPSVKYPVVYLLDAQWDFKLLDSIYGALVYDGFVPELMIVGLTYSGADADYNALRAMDYTPVKDESVKATGDAPKFLKFLQENVIPYINESFQTDPEERYLMGSSFGGTFTLFTLFTDPGLFRGYVAASPAVTYGSNYAIKQEAGYFADRQDLPARVYISVGEKESLQYPVKRYMELLEGRNYTDLKLMTAIIMNEGHASSKVEAYTRGLQFMFEE